MATKKTKPEDRLAKYGLVPLNLIVPKEIKEQLEEKAKQMGISVSQVASLLLDQKELEKQMRKLVKKETEETFTPYLSFLANTTSEVKKTKRFLMRILKNPLADISKIEKEIEEESRN